MNTRTYINAMDEAQSAVAAIVRLVKSGEVEPIVGIDTETAPIPGLEQYPGSEVEYVEVKNADGTTSVEEKPIRAKKETYLRFVQRLFRGSFSPSMLQVLRLHIPAKTISGKEDGVDARTAWSLFLRRLEEIYAAEGEARLLELARWTPEGLDAWLEGLDEEITALTEEADGLGRDIHSMDVMGVKKGLRTKESALKKVNIRLAALTEEFEFLNTFARARLEAPLDLRLLVHVARVAVEGRIYLSKQGSNRMDPVRPGLDPYTTTIFLLQITLRRKGTGELLSYIFNTHKVDPKALKPTLMLPATYIGANILFDLKLMMYHIGYAPKNVFCTRVASRVLNLGKRFMPHTLAAVYKRYLGGDISKEVRNSFIGRRYEEPTPEQVEYSYTDTEILPALYDALIKAAQERGQETLVRNFGKLSWIVAKWELDGYQIDTDRWLEIAAEAAESRDTLAHELEMMLLPGGYVETFLPNMVADATRGLNIEDEEADLKNVVFGDDEDDTKPAQDVRAKPVVRISQTELVKELLGKLLGMDLGMLFKDGKVSLGKDGRNLIEREYRKRHSGEGHEFFLKYAQWSKRAKQASTYGRRFLWYIHPLTGRIHPTFNIAGTDTGRFSSTNPNALNIPAAKEEGDPDFRSAFIALTGCFWLGSDYETMEFRIGGDISLDEVVRKMVESGADAHGFSAAQMFHIRKDFVDEPTPVQETYKRGTMEVPITVFLVPMEWSATQIADFALTQEVLDAVASVPKKITRGDAKSVTFLYLFRGTAYTLAMRTGLPLEQCEDFFGRFTGVYSGLDSYMNTLAEDALRQTVDEDGTRYAYSVGYGGIRRYVELPKEPHYKDFDKPYLYNQAAWEYKRARRRAQRELVNLPCQGGNAVITTQALLYLVERGEALGVYPVLSIYDEIIAQAPDSVPAQRVKGLLEGSMLDAADEYMHFIPAGAEADPKKAGKFWRKS